MEIDNITIYEYFCLEDSSAYDVYLDILNPSDSFCGVSCDVSAMTYDEVETIKIILRRPTIELIRDMFVSCFKIRGDIKQSGEELFFKQSVFDFFRAKLHIQNSIEKILEREQKAFRTDVDYKMLAIKGSERLQPYNHILSKDMLAARYGKEPDEIGRWKYSKVFRILAARSEQGRVQSDYSKQK